MRERLCHLRKGGKPIPQNIKGEEAFFLPKGKNQIPNVNPGSNL